MAADRAATLSLIQRRRRRMREWLTQWASLVETPHDLGNTAAGGTAGSPLTAPAPGWLSFECSAPLAAGDVTLTIGAEERSHPALAADSKTILAFVENGQAIGIQRGAGAPAGTLTVNIVDGLGQHFPVATCTFT